MKDTYTSDNFRDFTQRYGGTYGRYTKNDGSKITVRIDTLDRDNLYFSDVNETQYNTPVNSGLEFEFYPLTRKLTPWKDTVLYSYRKPERQWSRGVCSTNTAVMDVGIVKSRMLSFEIVDAIYNTKTDTPLETYIDFRNGKRNNFVLSDKLVVNRSGELRLFNTYIGKLDGNTVKVIPLFKQEVIDAIKRNNLNELKAAHYE